VQINNGNTNFNIRTNNGAVFINGYNVTSQIQGDSNQINYQINNGRLFINNHYVHVPNGSNFHSNNNYSNNNYNSNSDDDQTSGQHQNSFVETINNSNSQSNSSLTSEQD